MTNRAVLAAFPVLPGPSILRALQTALTACGLSAVHPNPGSVKTLLSFRSKVVDLSLARMETVETRRGATPACAIDLRHFYSTTDC
ncbi:hypothetical protein MUY21_07800 [Aliiroseovarius sp. S2029]|uniref:hypothetical protein n=1 Tax=Aliiroseovarius sp. S2029 TaxID=2936988 RepID=UPI0020BFA343|nr:hypothetical protein [Aliiroseovarius sp. S2029]MCK8483937.1 hypothetical protein [Aliiroseovarius sp. S2029]